MYARMSGRPGTTAAQQTRSSRTRSDGDRQQMRRSKSSRATTAASPSRESRSDRGSEGAFGEDLVGRDPTTDLETLRNNLRLIVRSNYRNFRRGGRLADPWQYEPDESSAVPPHGSGEEHDLTDKTHADDAHASNEQADQKQQGSPLKSLLPTEPIIYSRSSSRHATGRSSRSAQRPMTTTQAPDFVFPHASDTETEEERMEALLPIIGQEQSAHEPKSKEDTSNGLPDKTSSRSMGRIPLNSLRYSSATHGAGSTPSFFQRKDDKPPTSYTSEKHLRVPHTSSSSKPESGSKRHQKSRKSSRSIPSLHSFGDVLKRSMDPIEWKRAVFSEWVQVDDSQDASQRYHSELTMLEENLRQAQVMVADSCSEEGSPLLPALALGALERLQDLMEPCSGLLEVIKNILCSSLYSDPELSFYDGSADRNDEAEDDLVNLQTRTLPSSHDTIALDSLSPLSRRAYKYYRATTWREQAEIRKEELKKRQTDLEYSKSKIEDLKAKEQESIHQEQVKTKVHLAWSRLTSRKLFGDHMRIAHGATREALERIRSLESKLQPTIENVSKLFGKFTSSSEESRDSINDTQIACIKELTYSVPNLAYEIVYELLRRKSPNTVMAPYIVDAMMMRNKTDRAELIRELVKAIQEKDPSVETRKLLVESIVGAVSDPQTVAEDIHDVLLRKGTAEYVTTISSLIELLMEHSNSLILAESEEGNGDEHGNNRPALEQEPLSAEQCSLIMCSVSENLVHVRGEATVQALKGVLETVPVNIRDLVLDSVDETGDDEDENYETHDEEEDENSKPSKSKRGDKGGENCIDLVKFFNKNYTGTRWGVQVYYDSPLLSNSKKLSKYRSKAQVLLAEALVYYMEEQSENLLKREVQDSLSSDCIEKCQSDNDSIGKHLWRHTLQSTQSVSKGEKLLARILAPVYHLQDSSGAKLLLKDDVDTENVPVGEEHSCKSPLHQLHFFSFMFGGNTKLPYAPHLARTVIGFFQSLFPEVSLNYLKARRHGNFFVPLQHALDTCDSAFRESSPCVAISTMPLRTDEVEQLKSSIESCARTYGDAWEKFVNQKKGDNSLSQRRGSAASVASDMLAEETTALEEGTEFDIWTKVVRFECVMHRVCSALIRKYMKNFENCQKIFIEQAESSNAYPPTLSSFGTALSQLSPLVTPFTQSEEQESTNIQIPTASSPNHVEEGDESPRQRRNSIASLISQKSETTLSYEKVVYPLYEDFYAICSELLSRNSRMYHPMWKADVSRDSDPDMLRVTRAAHSFACVCCWYGLYMC
eukprot:gb/GECG01014714.1/.p1 GENE.gb/GECG01014714.1/~~gb/GECG01014714.1/.p1  ORF type:complete len:1277 (+),score=201.04 gb/GECG01014714.1/:1-3831(+)